MCNVVTAAWAFSSEDEERSQAAGFVFPVYTNFVVSSLLFALFQNLIPPFTLLPSAFLFSTPTPHPRRRLRFSPSRFFLILPVFHSLVLHFQLLFLFSTFLALFSSFPSLVFLSSPSSSSLSLSPYPAASHFSSLHLGPVPCPLQGPLLAGRPLGAAAASHWCRRSARHAFQGLGDCRPDFLAPLPLFAWLLCTSSPAMD